MTISYIFAMDRNRVIGLNNALPWRLPADMKFFKETTMGHTVIMGRKTFDSMGKPLPGRRNVVMSRNADLQLEGCEIVHTAEEAMAKYDDQGEVFVIGGEELFRLFMPYVNKLIITRIDHEFDGDAFFPPIETTEWKLVTSEPGVRDEKNPYDYRFETYIKRS